MNYLGQPPLDEASELDDMASKGSGKSFQERCFDAGLKASTENIAAANREIQRLHGLRVKERRALGELIQAAEAVLSEFQRHGDCRCLTCLRLERIQRAIEAAK